jgi:hypothetical protein
VGKVMQYSLAKIDGCYPELFAMYERPIMIVVTDLIPIVLVGMSLSKECVLLKSRVTYPSDAKMTCIKQEMA